MPSVSVIVPAYNTGNFVCKCLESILDQTFQDIEIIVVEQHSTDDTLEKILELRKSDPRIQVIQSTLRGPGLARNIGIAVASGKYISFIDSDDYIEENMLETLCNAAERYHADIVTSDFFVDDYKTGSSAEKKVDFCPYLPFNLKTDKQALGKLEGVPVWNKMYSKDFLLKNKLFFHTGIVFEDIPFILSAMLCAETVVRVEGSYYHYTANRPESITTEASKKSLSDFICAIQLTLDYCKKNYSDEFDNQLELFITKYILRSTKFLIWSKDEKPKNPDCLIEFLTDIFPNWKENTKDDIDIMALRKYTQLCSKIFKGELDFAGRPVIIFSASSGGMLMKDFLTKNKISVAAFCDNAQEKQGSVIDGIPVISPSYIAKEYKTDVAIVIAADMKYYKDVKKQLDTLGIGDENIY